MAHLYYEEEQRFTNVRWLWLVPILIIILPLLLTLNDKGLNQQEIIILLLSTLLASVPVVVILLYSKLQLRIDDVGIHYKFLPRVWNWKAIPKDQIESFELTAKKTLLEKLEIGYRRNLLSNTIMMNITGKKVFQIRLKNGKRLRIGAENPEGMERALKRLTTEDSLN